MSKELVMEQWEVRDDIYTAPLLIAHMVQSAFEAGKLHRRWTDRSDPLGFARRGLEVAIREACNEYVRPAVPSGVGTGLSEVIEEWRRTADHASEALDALNRLLRFLANGRDPERTAEIIQPIRTSTAFPVSASRATDAEVDVRSAARTLLESRDVLTKLAVASRTMQKQLSSCRQNEGKPLLMQFAKTLGESWVYLFGAAPTASRSGSMFQKYVAAAWEDAGGSIVGADGNEDQIFVRTAEAVARAFPPELVEILNSSPKLPDWAY